MPALWLVSVRQLTSQPASQACQVIWFWSVRVSESSICPISIDSDGRSGTDDAIIILYHNITYYIVFHTVTYYTFISLYSLLMSLWYVYIHQV